MRAPSEAVKSRDSGWLHKLTTKLAQRPLLPRSARSIVPVCGTWENVAMTGGRLVEERAERVVALLEDNVRTELQVRNDLLNLGLSDASIESLMQGVMSGLLYAFAVDWSPDWVKRGQVHHWEKSGRFFARCGICLLDSPPSPYEPTAVAWAQDHEKSH
jgi:hypothetical protein